MKQNPVRLKASIMVAIIAFGLVVVIAYAPMFAHDHFSDRIELKGQWLAFGCGNPASVPEGYIYLVREDGTGLHKLLPEDWNHVYKPRWSPDGEWILFQNNVTSSNTFPMWAIEAVKPDGTGWRRVTSSEWPDETVPSWSPDSQWVSFTSERADPNDIFATYRVSFSGGSPQFITHLASLEWSVAWSPDGKWIAATMDDGRIYVFQPDGSQPRRLVGANDVASGPSWSPDSQSLVYTSTREEDGQQGLYRIRLDGTVQEAIIRLHVVENPAWSPDGEWIAFYAEIRDDQGLKPGLYKIRPDGSDLQWITFQRGCPFLDSISWSPILD